MKVGSAFRKTYKGTVLECKTPVVGASRHSGKPWEISALFLHDTGTDLDPFRLSMRMTPDEAIAFGQALVDAGKTAKVTP